jgi:hypothetical protein
MPHRFRIGQAVEYDSPKWAHAPLGTYLVTARLPERNGEFEYHIRHPREEYERIARESELRAIADDGADRGPRKA